MLKKVRIAIKSLQHEIGGTLFDRAESAPLIAPDCEEQETELMMESTYYDDGTRVTLSYREGELTGMEGTKTTLSFQKNEPALVTMTRDGTVRTALVFEEGRRHLCIYQTPFMPFEVAVMTRRVENRIAENGTLHLVYTVELKGANAQHSDFSLTLLPDIQKPLGT
ncbi:MAG: DUF1934 domain-containing protein [Clostridia bacterium]|nr:DUF1934 domain-containing protein [Clostridia bacterium]